MGRKALEKTDQRIALLIQQSSQYITSPHYLSILLNALLNKNLVVQPWERSKMKSIVTKLKSVRDDLNILLKTNSNLPVKKMYNETIVSNTNTPLTLIQQAIRIHSLIPLNYIKDDSSKDSVGRRLNRWEFGAASSVARKIKEDNITNIDEIVSDKDKLKSYVDRWLEFKTNNQ